MAARTNCQAVACLRSLCSSSRGDGLGRTEHGLSFALAQTAWQLVRVSWQGLRFAGEDAVVSVTGRGGKVAFVGFGSGAPSVTPAEFIVKQLSLMGSFVFPIDHYFRILDFVRDRKIPLEATITHSVPLADAAEILPAFDRGETGKVILVP